MELQCVAEVGTITVVLLLNVKRTMESGHLEFELCENTSAGDRFTGQRNTSARVDKLNPVEC